MLVGIEIFAHVDKTDLEAEAIVVVVKGVAIFNVGLGILGLTLDRVARGVGVEAQGERLVLFVHHKGVVHVGKEIAVACGHFGLVAQHQVNAHLVSAAFEKLQHHLGGILRCVAIHIF